MKHTLFKPFRALIVVVSSALLPVSVSQAQLTTADLGLYEVIATVFSELMDMMSSTFLDQMNAQIDQIEIFPDNTGESDPDAGSPEEGTQDPETIFIDETDLTALAFKPISTKTQEYMVARNAAKPRSRDEHCDYLVDNGLECSDFDKDNAESLEDRWKDAAAIAEFVKVSDELSNRRRSVANRFVRQHADLIDKDNLSYRERMVEYQKLRARVEISALAQDLDLFDRMNQEALLEHDQRLEQYKQDQRRSDLEVETRIIAQDVISRDIDYDNRDWSSFTSGSES